MIFVNTVSKDHLSAFPFCYTNKLANIQFSLISFFLERTMLTLSSCERRIQTALRCFWLSDLPWLTVYKNNKVSFFECSPKVLLLYLYFCNIRRKSLWLYHKLLSLKQWWSFTVLHVFPFKVISFSPLQKKLTRNFLLTLYQNLSFVNIS